MEGISVLLIDASQSEADYLTQTIQREPAGGFHVSRASSLIQGINFLRTATADVLLLDLDLLNTAGFKDITFMHKLFPNLPIIVISDASSMEVQRKALQSGAQAFLAKGQSDGIMLQNTICELLASHNPAPEQSAAS